MKSAGRNAASLARSVVPVLRQNMGLRAPTDPLVSGGEPLDLDRWGRSSLAAYWLGHATVLLRIGGITVLTDPHFGEHTAPRFGGRKIGRRRSTSPPMSIEELPPIDVVMLSHAHMDHWEKESLRKLGRSETCVVIPRRTRSLLPSRGGRFGDVVECHWGDATKVRGLEVAALQPKHWGARYGIDWWRGYNAYLITTGATRVMFAGDTGETNAFDPLGPVDLAILGIGNSYEPWARHHTSPEQAAAMAQRLSARLLAPVHHATFHDAAEGRDEPIERLMRVWPQERTVCARVGDAYYEGSG